MPNPVTEAAAPPPALAVEHFTGKLAFETDCADVHDALKGGEPGFVLLETRGPGAYARGHVPCALNLPHRAMTEEALAAWPPTRCSWSTAPVRIATAPTGRRCASRGSVGG